MNVIFAGTPEFAAVALQSLYDAGHVVPLVLTQPDRPAGRGMQLQPSAVKQLAAAHGTPVAQPVSLRLNGRYPDVAEQAHQLLKATPHDVMVVAAYGLILPPSVLALPPLGCLNIHASLLPRWRGAAPIHRAIEAGDAETGITIMQMEEGLDTGPMLLREAVPILPDDTTANLHDRLAALGGKMIVEVLAQMANGPMRAVPQPTSGVTYAEKIAKEEALIDFRSDAAAIDRKIRAFNPFPGACAVFNGITIKLWRAEMQPLAANKEPGSILSADAENGLVVACGRDALRLTELQRPGGKRMASAAFLQGFPMTGGRFG